MFNDGKCGVVVSCRRKATTEKWMIGSEEIKEEPMYKYLGIEKKKVNKWKMYVDRIISKGRNRLVISDKLNGNGWGCHISMGLRPSNLKERNWRKRRHPFHHMF